MTDYTILVNTCDAYSDLWNSFFYLLNINWPDSKNHKIIINTETIKNVSYGENVSTINTKYSDHDRWGGRLIHCLNEIDTDYVIVLMDDFFLRRPIDTKVISDVLNLMEKEPKTACFYLVNTLKENGADSEYTGFTSVEKWRNYRLNSAPAIWRKASLLKYTKENDNPWAWEYFGSCRTNLGDDEFYTVSSVDSAVYDYAHAIYRGKWLGDDILPLLDKYNLDIDLNKRGIINRGEKLPKRSIRWKVKYVFTGIKMVGFLAFIPLCKDIKKKYFVKKEMRRII